MGAAVAALGYNVPASARTMNVAASGADPICRREPWALALETCPVPEDLAALTDSKSRTDLQQSMQQADPLLRLYKHQDPARELLVHMALLINQRVVNGAATGLVNVKAHTASESVALA